MSRIGRSILVAALTGLLGLVVLTPAHAAQIPGTPCQSTGNGTICYGSFSNPTEYYDTGASCGTGASAFEILGTFTDAGNFEVYVNQQGLPTEVVVHHNATGTFYNSTDLSKVINAPGHWQDIYTFGVPGDPTTVTLTQPGQVYKEVAPGFGLLFHDVGNISFAPDGTVTIHGPHQQFLDMVGIFQTLCPVLA
jgi:hypothetical protein